MAFLRILSLLSPSQIMPPLTAHSARPYTAPSRPTTAASARYSGTHAVAVLEGRGISREVGLASLDKDTGYVMLVQVLPMHTSSLNRINTMMQLADCPTYVKTLHQMHLHTPCVVLVPDTFLSATDSALAPGGKRSSSTSLLVEYIREEFPGVTIEAVGRKYWNDAGGNFKAEGRSTCSTKIFFHRS